MPRYKYLMVLLLACMVSAGIARLAFSKSNIEKVMISDTVSAHLYWNDKEDIEKLSVVDAEHEIPEYYKPSTTTEDGTKIQLMDIEKTSQFIEYDAGSIIKLYHKNGNLTKREQFNSNGVLIALNEYKNQWLSKVSADKNADGVMDAFTYFDDNKQIIKAEIDYDNDGKIDETLLPGKDF